MGQFAVSANYGYPTIYRYASVGTRGGFSLSSASAYVLGTSGNCLGFRFYALTTTTITDVYWFIDEAPASNPNDLRCDVTGLNATQLYRPNVGTILASKSVSGGTTSDVWLKFTLDTPVSVTAGQAYWVTIGDAVTAASPYTILSRGGGYTGHQDFDYNLHASIFSQTAGFSANGTAVAPPSPCVVKCADGIAYGHPLTGISAAKFTSNQLSHGLYLPSVAESCFVIHLSCGNSLNGFTLRCHEDDVAPGGTIYPGFNGGSGVVCTSGAYGSFPPCLLRKGHAYRFVLVHTTGSAYPNCSQVENGSGLGTDIIPALYTILGPIYATEDNGAGAWKTYDNATDGFYVPVLSLTINDIAPLRSIARAGKLQGMIDQ